MAVGKLVVHEHGHGAVLIPQALPHGAGFGLRNLKTGPTIPLEAGGLGQAAEASDQTARAHGKAVLAVVGALNRDWQAVGDQQQPTPRAGLVFLNAWHCDVVRVRTKATKNSLWCEALFRKLDFERARSGSQLLARSLLESAQFVRNSRGIRRRCNAEIREKSLASHGQMEKVKRRFNAERGKQVWRVTGEGGAVANWRRGFGKRQTACWGGASCG